MRCHRSEEDQESAPYKRDRNEEVDRLSLGRQSEVRDDDRRDDEYRNRNQRVAGRDEDIPEGSFTIEQSGQAPVGYRPEKHRHENRGQLDQDSGISSARVEDITGADRLIVEGEYREREPYEGRTDRSAVFMLQIPEAVKRINLQSYHIFYLLMLFHD